MPTLAGWLGCGIVSYKAARWLYFGLFGLYAALVWVCREYGSAFASVGSMVECHHASSELDEDAVKKCFAKEGVLRLSFATFIFFTAHLVLLLVLSFCFREGRHAQLAQAGFFPVKLLTLVVLGCISIFAVRNGSLDAYFQIARALAAVFLLLQLLVVLEKMFRFNERVVTRPECICPVVLATAVLFAAFVSGIVLLYIYFSPNVRCSRNIALITTTLLLSVAATALSVSSIRIESAGLLTAMMISVYGVWLCAAGLYSAPPDDCSSLTIQQTAPEEGINWMTVSSFVAATGSLIMTCVSTASSHEQVMGIKATDGAAAAGEDDGPPHAAVFHHFTFCCATCFVLMAFTNWSLQGTPGSFELDRGAVSMWTKMGAQYISFGLYFWILVAPRLMQGRFQ